MTECHPRSYGTAGVVKGRYRTIWVFSCTPCEIYGKSFLSKEKRDEFRNNHTKEKNT
jgi:hypothetical protein